MQLVALTVQLIQGQLRSPVADSRPAQAISDSIKLQPFIAGGSLLIIGGFAAGPDFIKQEQAIFLMLTPMTQAGNGNGYGFSDGEPS